jgi:hypothetical protein
MIKAELPFGARTARMIAAIGRDARIRNHGSVLPTSWRTLYELTRLTDEQFRQGLASGAINSEMRRSDVAALCPSNFLDISGARLIATANSLLDGMRDYFDAQTNSGAEIAHLNELFRDYNAAKEKYLSFDDCDASKEADLKALSRVSKGEIGGAGFDVVAKVRDQSQRLIEPCNQIIAGCERRLAALQGGES